MSKNRKRISFITFLIVLSILSGVITYRIVVGKSSKKPVAESSHKKDNADGEKNIEYKESNILTNDAFNSIEKLYIKTNEKAWGEIELSGKDKGIVVANFKALQKKRTGEAELKKQMLDLDSYNYQIDIAGKNIKIKLFAKSEHIMLEKTEDTKEIYKVEKEEFQSFIVLLEDIYLNKLVEKILYPLPNKIHLSARDEDALYIMNKNEIKDLVSKFKVLSIEDSEEYIGTPTIYPDYNISFKRDDYEYNLSFKNSELMIMNTPIVYLYCKYDRELWNYIEEKLPRENKAKENELKFLMKAERIEVKDLDGVYSFQNDSYYNIEIPRQILKSNLKKLGSLSDIIIEEDLELILKFLVNGKSKEVLVYINHIVYDDNVYYAKNIKEHIISTLIVP